MRRVRTTNRTTRGFTVVELLIVVVVIAILAIVSFIAFNGIQQRARDSQRVQDMNAIIKALEMYKTTYGTYPAAVGNSPGGWEVSSNPNANHPFLDQLVVAGVMPKVPRDPVNVGDMNTAGSKIYAYYRYGAGSNGCPTAYYVLIVRTGEASSASSSSPGGSCGTASASGWWTKIQQDQ